MIRLSNSSLVAALRFVEELGAVKTLSELREFAPAGLQRLVPADRISLDELDLSFERRRVVPTPVPTWWSRLGEVHAQHAHEHPLWRGKMQSQSHQAVSFSDYADDAAWKTSTLYHEYYLSLGVRWQLGVQIQRTGTEMFSLAFSRSHLDFTLRDRALVELLSPHVGNALCNARALAVEKTTPKPITHSELATCEIIGVKPDRMVICLHSAGAGSLLREFFDHDTGVGSGLPDEVRRWLQVRKEWLARGELIASALSPLVIRRGSRQLLIRLACYRPDEATLLLECAGINNPGDEVRASSPVLTPREREILRWAGEGKRNAEIAIILGLSYRTVEKHFENIFAKLGVETRTAAIRLSLGKR